MNTTHSHNHGACYYAVGLFAVSGSDALTKVNGIIKMEGYFQIL